MLAFIHGLGEERARLLAKEFLHQLTLERQTSDRDLLKMASDFFVEQTRVLVPNRPQVNVFTVASEPFLYYGSWPEQGGAVVHHWQFLGSAGGMNWAWALARERTGCIVLNELVVRPEYRGRRLGSRLANEVARFAHKRGLPLSAFVPRTYSREAAPSTYRQMLAVVRRMGMTFLPVPRDKPEAAYYATNAEPGSLEPVTEAPLPPPPKPAAFPRPGETRWDEMIDRHATLVRQKLGGLLTPSERDELEALTYHSNAALDS